MRRLPAATLLGSLLLTAPNGRGKQSRGIIDDVTFASGTAPSPVAGRARGATGAPECVPSSGVFCLQDTTYRRHATDFEMYAWASILWFGRSGDSLVLSTNANTVQTTIGDDKDSLHNNVPSYHGRVPRDGSITIWASMDEERGDSVPYTLRVQDFHPSSASSALEPTGKTARLVIPSPGPRRYAEISVIPLSQVRAGLDRTAWKTYPGSHKVALTRDSLYEVCLLPCVVPRTIKLRPNQAVSWKY